MPARSPQNILQAINRAQQQYIVDNDPARLSETLLNDFIKLTGSEVGFIGEVTREPDGTPGVLMHAITNIAWDETSRQRYADIERGGLKFSSLDNLFGHVLKSGQVVIANDPATDPRAGGLPDGHPAIDCFLGLPVMFKNELLGLVGVANRAGGYDQEVVSNIAPLVTTYGQILAACHECRRRRATQSELNTTRQLLNAIVNNAVDAIITIDTSGIVQDCNPATEKMFGFGPEELIGHNITRIMPPEMAHQHDGFLAKYLQTGDARIIGIGREVIAQHKSGRKFTVDLSVTRFEINGAVYFCGSLHDISRYKRTEAALRESEERLIRSQNFANIGTWDWNIQSGELYWSERIGPLFGYPEGKLETTYENFLNAVHPEDRQAVIDAVNACVERGEDYNIEHRCMWPDGTIRWMLERGDVVRDASGKPLHMLGVVQDITPRKLAEQELDRQKTLFESVFHDVPDAMILVDTERRIIMCNPAVTTVFGYTEAELVGKTTACLYAESHEYLRQGQLRYNPTAERDGRSYVVDYRHKSGSIFPGETVGSPIKNAEGELLGYIGMVRDVTEREQTRQALIDAKELAENANRAKSQFLSRMSHELRTPMNAILGFSQLLQIDKGLDDTQQDNIQEIINAGQHLLELINEVLDLARIEAGRVTLNIDCVVLTDVLNECLSITSTQADKYQVEMEIDIASCSDCKVQADRIRLKQVLLNLLSNAVKYNKPQGKVQVYCECLDDRIHIHVKDTGYGIAEDRQHGLFRPFDRLGAEESKIEGTGIGLVISKNLVEMMGGQIAYTSIANNGADFWVELQRVEAENRSTISDKDSTRKIVMNNQPQAGRFKVLYVEDNAANLRLVEKTLTRLPGYELFNAHDAEQGMALAMQLKPDLILMDLHLPGMSGMDALKLLRNMHETSAIPVIAISANAMEADIKAGIKAGFNDYLTKPLEIDMFIDVLEKYRLAAR